MRIRLDDNAVIETNEIAGMYKCYPIGGEQICFCLRGGNHIISKSKKAYEIFRVWETGGPYITRNVESEYSRE
jgi:hypothetical protein